MGGSRREPSSAPWSSSSDDSRYTFRKPSNLTTSPVAVNCGAPAAALPPAGSMAMATVVFSISASAIWLAAVRFHIRS